MNPHCENKPESNKGLPLFTCPSQAVSITTVTFVSLRSCVNECVNTLSLVLWLSLWLMATNSITTQKQRTNATATTWGVDRWGPGPNRTMENLWHSPPGWPIGPLQVAIHVVQTRRTGEQKSHWDKTNKGNYHLKLCMPFVCLVAVRLLLTSTAVLYHMNGYLQRAY